MDAHLQNYFSVLQKQYSTIICMLKGENHKLSIGSGRYRNIHLENNLSLFFSSSILQTGSRLYRSRNCLLPVICF